VLLAWQRDDGQQLAVSREILRYTSEKRPVRALSDGQTPLRVPIIWLDFQFRWSAVCDEKVDSVVAGEYGEFIRAVVNSVGADNQ
jgi:hypothetical protein